MGYYTRYKLKIEPPQTLDFVNALGMCMASHNPWVEHDGSFLPFGGDETKWYEHREEMQQASAVHPGLLFILDGEGEDAGDVWRDYHKGGRVHEWRPVLTPEPFDESKLK